MMSVIWECVSWVFVLYCLSRGSVLMETIVRSVTSALVVPAWVVLLKTARFGMISAITVFVRGDSVKLFLS